MKVKNNRGFNIELSYYEKEETASQECIIYLHCFNGSRLESKKFVDLVLSKGIAFCSFDFTGSGLSEGQFVSLGYYEQEDVLAVINYLKQSQQIKKIALWGRSMGGVTALLFTQRFGQCVEAMVIDSAFVSMMEAGLEIADKRVKLPTFMIRGLLEFVRRQIKMNADFDMDDVDALKDITKCGRVPVLFVVSREDKLLSSDHSQRLFENYPRNAKKNIIFTHGDHNEPRDIETLTKIIDFLVQTMKQMGHSHFSLSNKRSERKRSDQGSVITQRVTQKDDIENNQIPSNKQDDKIQSEAAAKVDEKQVNHLLDQQNQYPNQKDNVVDCTSPSSNQISTASALPQSGVLSNPQYQNQQQLLKQQIFFSKERTKSQCCKISNNKIINNEDSSLQKHNYFMQENKSQSQQADIKRNQNHNINANNNYRTSIDEDKHNLPQLSIPIKFNRKKTPPEDSSLPLTERNGESQSRKQFEFIQRKSTLDSLNSKYEDKSDQEYARDESTKRNQKSRERQKNTNEDKCFTQCITIKERDHSEKKRKYQLSPYRKSKDFQTKNQNQDQKSLSKNINNNSINNRTHSNTASSLINSDYGSTSFNINQHLDKISGYKLIPPNLKYSFKGNAEQQQQPLQQHQQPQQQKQQLQQQKQEQQQQQQQQHLQLQHQHQQQQQQKSEQQQKPQQHNQSTKQCQQTQHKPIEAKSNNQSSFTNYYDSHTTTTTAATINYNNNSNPKWIDETNYYASVQSAQQLTLLSHSKAENNWNNKSNCKDKAIQKCVSTTGSAIEVSLNKSQGCEQRYNYQDLGNCGTTATTNSTTVGGSNSQSPFEQKCSSTFSGQFNSKHPQLFKQKIVETYNNLENNLSKNRFSHSRAGIKELKNDSLYQAPNLQNNTQFSSASNQTIPTNQNQLHFSQEQQQQQNQSKEPYIYNSIQQEGYNSNSFSQERIKDNRTISIYTQQQQLDMKSSGSSIITSSFCNNSNNTVTINNNFISKDLYLEKKKIASKSRERQEQSQKQNVAAIPEECTYRSYQNNNNNLKRMNHYESLNSFGKCSKKNTSQQQQQQQQQQQYSTSTARELIIDQDYNNNTNNKISSARPPSFWAQFQQKSSQCKAEIQSISNFPSEFSQTRQNPNFFQTQTHQQNEKVAIAAPQFQSIHEKRQPSNSWSSNCLEMQSQTSLKQNKQDGWKPIPEKEINPKQPIKQNWRKEKSFQQFPSKQELSNERIQKQQQQLLPKTASNSSICSPLSKSKDNHKLCYFKESKANGGTTRTVSIKLNLKIESERERERNQVNTPPQQINSITTSCNILPQTKSIIS